MNLKNEMIIIIIIIIIIIMITIPKGLGSRKQVNILKNNTTLLSFKDMFRHP